MSPWIMSCFGVAMMYHVSVLSSVNDVGGIERREQPEVGNNSLAQNNRDFLPG